MEEPKYAKEEKPDKVAHKKSDTQLLDLIVTLFLSPEKNERLQRCPVEINR